MQSREAITCFGGGRGQSTTLEAIALYHPRELINSVCTSADDGGDSGRKRLIGERLGVQIVPPGDMRRCMQPLASPKAQLWWRDFAEMRRTEDCGDFEGLTFRSLCLIAKKSCQIRFTICPEASEILNYKFGPEWGKLDNSCLGNTMLAICQIKYGVQEGIDVARKIIDVPGDLAPVSLVPGHINAVYGLLGQPKSHIRTSGESELDRLDQHPRYHPEMHPVDLSYLHELPLNPRVNEFIARSKQLVFSMGSWYTSLFANLMVDNCIGVIAEAQTQNTLIINLFWSQGEAHHLRTASAYVRDFHQRTKGAIRLDKVILNNSETAEGLSPSVTAAYLAEGKQLIKGNEIECLEILELYPQADVRLLPLAKRVPGSSWIGHDIFMLGKNITS